MDNALSFFAKLFKSKSFWIKVLFIAIAAIFWLLIKLSKSGYVTTIQYPVLYENVPQNKILVSKATHNITLRISSFGFRLLGYEINRVTPLRIDVKRQVRKAPNKNDVYYWLPNLYTEELESQLDGQTSLLRLEPDTVFLVLSERVKKQVPVVLNIETSFKPGFGLYQQPVADPAMVTLFGPSIYLDTIEAIQAVQMSILNINTEVDKKVKLNFNHKMVEIEPKSVQVKIEVGQFTEKIIEVPIRITNVPKGYKASIVPTSVIASCKVAARDYDELSSSDIEVVCDFAQLLNYPDRKQLQLKLRMIGSNFSVDHLSQSNIDFLLFKQ